MTPIYRNILLAVDVDEPSSWADALPAASSLARAFSARLTLCSVVRDADVELQAEWSSIGCRAIIDHVRTGLHVIAEQAEGLDAGVEIGFGTIVDGVLDVAKRIGADLIVLASHRPRMADWLLAANAARVARRAACSVLVVRSGPAPQARRRTRGAALASADGAAP
jgi:nucleotide-binding universal stress UspA family protein